MYLLHTGIQIKSQKVFNAKTSVKISQRSDFQALAAELPLDLSLPARLPLCRTHTCPTVRRLLQKSRDPNDGGSKECE